MTSSTIIPSGKYIIRNVGHEHPVGLPPITPTTVPIVASPTAQIWHIRHIKDHLYALSVHGFSAVARNELVWGELEPTNKEHEWVIQERAEGTTEFTISEGNYSGNCWTLEEDKEQVSLEYFMRITQYPPVINPKSLWSFVVAS